MQVEKVQNELDGLAATLKQVELYNEQMKGEIAVTRRCPSVITSACAPDMPTLVKLPLRNNETCLMFSEDDGSV